MLVLQMCLYRAPHDHTGLWCELSMGVKISLFIFLPITRGKRILNDFKEGDNSSFHFDLTTLPLVLQCDKIPHCSSNSRKKWVTWTNSSIAVHSDRESTAWSRYSCCICSQEVERQLLSRVCFADFFLLMQFRTRVSDKMPSTFGVGLSALMMLVCKSPHRSTLRCIFKVILDLA